MECCECGKEFKTKKGLASHKHFCKIGIPNPKKLSSKYKVNDNLYICECKKEFDNYQSLNGHLSHCLIHRNGKPLKRISHRGTMNWNNLSSEKIKEIAKKAGKTLSKKIKNGELIPYWKNKHHTSETKAKLSENSNPTNHGFIKTKYYEVYCPYENKFIKVQGTWELLYAEWMNRKSIQWIKSRKIKLKYKLEHNDFQQTYYPDFYLPESNEFIEIKGFYWKSKDGRIDDRRKLDTVKKDNPNIKLTIITDIKPYKIA